MVPIEQSEFKKLAIGKTGYQMETSNLKLFKYKHEIYKIFCLLFNISLLESPIKYPRQLMQNFTTKYKQRTYHVLKIWQYSRKYSYLKENKEILYLINFDINKIIFKTFVKRTYIFLISVHKQKGEFHEISPAKRRYSQSR